MGIKKFVNDVTDVLGLKNFDEQKKKKAIKKLLKKLEHKREVVESQLANHPKDKQSKELADELELIHYQIKKGKKLLAKLEKVKLEKVKSEKSKLEKSAKSKK